MNLPVFPHRVQVLYTDLGVCVLLGHGGFETFGEVALGTKAEVKDLPSASQSSEVVTEYESQADATSRPVASAVLGSGGLGAGTEEPNVSPSDLTNSPLSVSEPENDDSSLEDENPIGKLV